MAEIGQGVAGACYTCVFCGYVYDPAIGDPGENIPPGTPFANLPEDWCCPNCSTEKDTFERCE